MHHAQCAKTMHRRNRRSARRSFETTARPSALYESLLCYMRLPQHLIESPFFALSSAEEMASALGSAVKLEEVEQIKRLASVGLPPVTSVDALAVMFGVNPGIIWSFINRPRRHYRIYEIPKGKDVRTIASPHIGLKIIQSWIGYHLSRSINLPPHVFGFVPKRSHIDAAFEHRNAHWAYSIDIENFFGTTPAWPVIIGLKSLGYSATAAEIIFRLSSIGGYLAQGSPISPTLSNLAFLQIDSHLADVASRFECRLSRYADDIVFSGQTVIPVELPVSVKSLFLDSPWKLAAGKERIEPVKGRIKVHGLIVNRENLRLTKGYRNKVRAYRHILAKGEHVRDHATLRGHVLYHEHVSNRLSALETNPPQQIAFNYPEFSLPIPQLIKIEDQKKGDWRKILSRLTRFFEI